MTHKNNSIYARYLAYGMAILSFLILLLVAVLILVFSGLQSTEAEFVYAIILHAVTFSLNTIVYTILALLILYRYPRHTIGWLFMIIGFFSVISLLTSVLGENVSQFPNNSNTRGVIAWISDMVWRPVIFFPSTLILLFFPDGRLPSRRWRFVLIAILGGIGGVIVSAAFHPWPWEESQRFLTNNPFGITGSERLFEFLNRMSYILLVFGVIGSLASLIFRFYKSQSIVRQQMKWLAYTASIGITSALLLASLSPTNPIVNVLGFILPTILATTIGVAILRYRLYDIDIIIRRTLVYGLVSATLVAVYFGSVVLFQNLFARATGQQSPIAIVISTLLIAALFNPVRGRVQDFVDRGFYRTKYDAQQTLARFAQTARDETDLEELTAELLSVVEETMQPEQVTLWLKPAEHRAESSGKKDTSIGA